MQHSPCKRGINFISGESRIFWYLTLWLHAITILFFLFLLFSLLRYPETSFCPHLASLTRRQKKKRRYSKISELVRENKGIRDGEKNRGTTLFYPFCFDREVGGWHKRWGLLIKISGSKFASSGNENVAAADLLQFSKAPSFPPLLFQPTGKISSSTLGLGHGTVNRLID